MLQLKKSLFLIFLLNMICNFAFTKEKTNIINKIESINNFKFEFSQSVSGKEERGNCTVAFNNRMRCEYKNKNKKEIIINNKTLVVVQKRYNKISYYPITKSMFINILNKDNLLNIIKVSERNEYGENISLEYNDKNNQVITIFFDKKSFNLLGWKTEDQFGNQIFFSIKIISINQPYNLEIFKIPSLN